MVLSLFVMDVDVRGVAVGVLKCYCCVVCGVCDVVLCETCVRVCVFVCVWCVVCLCVAWFACLFVFAN